MSTKNYLALSFLLLLLSSCASTYRPVNPKSLNYFDSQDVNGISFSYQFDVLHHAGNKKYAKHERKQHVRVVALKMVNNTGRTLNPSADIEILSGNRVVSPLEPAATKRLVQQGVPIYLLYLLLTPLKFYSGDSEGVPIGLGIGPGVTAFNIIKASSANKHFAAELQEYSLNKPLESGKTMYALVGLDSPEYAPLTIRVK